MDTPPGPSEGKKVTILHNGPFDSLNSPKKMAFFLRESVRRIDMRPIGEPVVHDIPLEIKKLGMEPFEDEGGISGIVVLSTSHLAIHTWPLRNRSVLEAYSCREFDEKILIDLLREVFGATAFKVSDSSGDLKWDELDEPQRTI